MAVSFDKLNTGVILKDLGSACLKCPNCEKSDCLIGYGKQCITNCVTQNITYVEDGFANIPMGDFKKYDEETLINGIANILQLCGSCKENHFENCIINILRSCYELELFGETQEYNGDAIEYIIKLNHSEHKQGISSRIVDAYHKADYLNNK